MVNSSPLETNRDENKSRVFSNVILKTIKVNIINMSVNQN